MKKDNDICFRITVKDPELQKMLDDLQKVKSLSHGDVGVSHDNLTTKNPELQKIQDDLDKVNSPKNSQKRIAELDEQNIEPQKLYRIMKKPTPTFWICASIIFVGLLLCGTYYLVNKDNGRYQIVGYDVVDKKTGEVKPIKFPE